MGVARRKDETMTTTGETKTTGYSAWMRWPNGDAAEPIVRNVTKREAMDKADIRIASWDGFCDHLPKCYVTYDATGEVVYTIDS
jgi:hypothetical protein